MRSVIAEQVAVELLERRSPDLIATRPLVLTAVEAILETSSFSNVLRQTALTAHGVLIRGDTDVVVELQEVRTVLLPALQSASPALARQLPSDLSPQIAELRATDAATGTVRFARSASVAAIPLLLASFLAFAGAIATAPDRRRAFGTAGLCLAVGMGLGVAALAALRAQVISHTGAVGIIGQDQARAAAGAAWAAFAGDLQRLLLLVGGLGAAIWVGSVLTATRLDRGRLARGIADALAGGSLPAGARVARGLTLAALGGLVLLGWDPVAGIVAVLVGGAALLLGLGEALSVSRSLPAADAPRRRRRLLAGAAAVVVAGAAVLAVVVITSRPPAPIADAELVACNGLPELCDRRLDQVVLPGTHNSMSAADRPGWALANQRRPIPRQLEDGLRLLLLDPHYGVVNQEGRIRTDLEAEGTTRNRVAAQIGADALRAAERIAGRVGLVPSGGERKVFLCHSLCELGAEPLGRTLGEVRQFLERERAEVLVLQLESSVRPEAVEKAFADAKLERYLATLPRSGPLPTLRKLITSGRRLVVLDERDGGTEPWYQPGFLFAQNTSIEAFTRDPLSCAPDRGSPDSPLLLMNHWVDAFPPSPSAARRVNGAGSLGERVARCRKRLGRGPNLIAVDFFDLGDVVAYARELNRSGVLLRGRGPG